MNFLDAKIEPLGLGCWPLSGAMYADGQSVGYTGSDDASAMRAIHAALDHGITLFDTAAAYGAGHGERLLGRALQAHPEAVVVTKIGVEIDENAREITGSISDPARVVEQIDNCRARLGRDCLDVVLLHLNSEPIATALPMFECMQDARRAGKIRAFGWSTDFSDRAGAIAGMEGALCVEHAMNLFIPASRVQARVRTAGMIALIRSPLAMGLLSGKYGTHSQLPKGDIRAGDHAWMSYYKNGRPNAELLARLDAVRDLLQTGGRTSVQGALGWLWAKGGHNLPVPGARNVEQVRGLAGALEFGPLPEGVMVEIERLLPPEDHDAPERER